MMETDESSETAARRLLRLDGIVAGVESVDNALKRLPVLFRRKIIASDQVREKPPEGGRSQGCAEPTETR